MSNLSSNSAEDPTPAVECVLFGSLDEAHRQCIQELLARYGLVISVVESESIPGSYWGDSEAGLKGQCLYVRADTPVHSLLHEACHYICMSPARREGLDTNAGGDYDEENGVCYLQILLAEQLPFMGASRMCLDMDSWGYTFRLGSASAWFERDAQDARDWLLTAEVLTPAGGISGNLRTTPDFPKEAF